MRKIRSKKKRGDGGAVKDPTRFYDAHSLIDDDDDGGILVVLGHINNLYNTTFWALQQKGRMSATEAEKELKVTKSTFL